MAKRSAPPLPSPMPATLTRAQKIFYAIVVLWLAALTAYTLTVAQSVYRFSYNSANQTLDAYYQTYRIQFCYENDLKPCDDVSIGEWNKSHPDDMFSLTRPSLGSAR